MFSAAPILKSRLPTISEDVWIKNQKNRKNIDYRVDSKVDKKPKPKCSLQHTTPFMRHKRTQRTIAQTTGSQFPRVPIVKVNGLNSQNITELTQNFSGTPRSFKILLIKYPTSKSEAEKRNLPQDRWKIELGMSKKASKGEYLYVDLR